VDAADVVFDGDRALAWVTEFATRFPDRDSGMPNNAAAAVWLEERFAALGLACRIDRWEIVNYGRAVPLQNVVCELPDERPERIVLVAHLDQSPRTVQGADNDASGIGVLLHLAEVFAAEPTPRYGLVFLASDAEEYGMLGTRRFLATQPDSDRLTAGLSLDNLGKWFYDGVDLDPRGQFRGYGALWFQLLVRDVAVAVGETPAPRVFGVVDQLLGQAVPISFMDKGPLVAAGVPAVGLAAFLAGGLVVYALIYFMGFEILRIGWHVLWYLLMMFAIPTVSFAAALVITAVVAAGLSLVVRPVGGFAGVTAGATRPGVPDARPRRVAAPAPVANRRSR